MMMPVLTTPIALHDGTVMRRLGITVWCVCSVDTGDCALHCSYAATDVAFNMCGHCELSSSPQQHCCAICLHQ
jgi:hypothetical protein